MVPIPDSTFLVTAALFRQSEKGQDSRREHLGASAIGEECLRKLWYEFRWAMTPWRAGRIMRVLRRGKQEEQTLIADLRELGYQVEAAPRVLGVNGHFGGTPDGMILGIPGDPEAWHILELKTTFGKGWLELVKHGVQEAMPTHYAQMQCYMAGSKIDRALYLAVNKDNDEIYEERVPLDQVFAQRMLEKAERIISRQSLPERISDDPAWYECRTCSYHAICHSHQMSPERTCRSCLHVTPEVGGPEVLGTPDVGKTKVPGGWWCSVHKKHLTEAEQKAGCPSHLFLPSLLWWLEQVDATEDSVIYRHTDSSVVPVGTEWTDGPVKP